MAGVCHPGWSALVLLAGAAIALTSNFVNLTDLRPGRALKVYSVLALCAVASAAVGLGPAVGLEDLSALGSSAGAVGLMLFLLGPVLAVWRYDLGERGMLGDAGANPMGAVAGLLIVAGLPAWGVVAYFAVMLALNLASERYSFSRLDRVERGAQTARHARAQRGAADTRRRSKIKSPTGCQPRVESLEGVAGMGPREVGG